MRVKSLYVCTRLIAASFTKMHSKLHNLTKNTHTKHHLRNFLVGVGFAVSLNYVYAIEDEAIRNLKYTMGKEINALRSEYGQTTVYP